MCVRKLIIICADLAGAYYKAKLPSTLTYVRVKKKKFQSKKKLPTVLQINRVYDFVQVYPNYSQEIA